MSRIDPSSVDALCATIDAQHRDTWPAALDLAALSRIEPHPPRWIVADWLPEGYAALLAGHGGVGKSGIALHLACCIALGRDWWGVPTQQRRVLYLSCEDRADVLHWRLSRIAQHEGLSLAALAGHLSVLDAVGRDTVLWQPSPSGAVLTAPYGFLRERMTGHDVLMVDGISDTYGGGENARAEVRAYVHALLALAPESGALVLIGHVAKSAASAPDTSEGYSGSTAWHNSVRARWYLYPESAQDDDGHAERTGDLILAAQKTNHGRAGAQMRMTWDDDAHLYTGQMIGGRTRADNAARDRREQDGILAALRAVAARGDYCPSATTGKRTAHNVLSACPELPESLRGKAGSRRFWRHVEALRRMRLITTGSIRRSNRHIAETLQAVEPVNTGAAPNAPNNGKDDSARNGASAPAPNAPNGAGVIGGGAHAHDYGDIRG